MAALAYGAALGRLPRIRLLSGLPLAAAAVLIVERGLMATGHPAALALTWLTVYAVGVIALTIVWTMAGAVFDSRQARRLFPLCTAAAIAGSFFGTLLAGPVARSIGTPNRWSCWRPPCSACSGSASSACRGSRRSGRPPAAATSRSWPTCGSASTRSSVRR